MALLFQDKIRTNKEAFTAKLLTVSDSLGVPADWLMAVFNSESGMDPMAVNPSSGATGLLQWMPNTARGLGTTTTQLRNMSNVQQLDYVYKYFLPYKNLISNYEDLYLITFYPNAEGVHGGTLKKPDSWAFPNSVYLQNKVIDMNKDGKLTIDDFKKFVYKKVPADLHSTLNRGTGLMAKAKNSIGTIIFILALIGFYIMFKKDIIKALQQMGSGKLSKAS